MTYEEAKEALKVINLSRVHPFYSWEEMLNVRDKAIESLEKQIPKKPVDDDGLYCCPICKEGVEFEDFYDLPYSAVKFCVNCGQRLDWSEENA